MQRSPNYNPRDRSSPPLHCCATDDVVFRSIGPPKPQRHIAENTIDLLSLVLRPDEGRSLPGQNRRQKVFNKEVLGLCGGSWHSKNWRNLNWFIVFHVSLWGDWAPKTPPWRRDCAWPKPSYWFVNVCQFSL